MASSGYHLLFQPACRYPERFGIVGDTTSDPNPRRDMVLQCNHHPRSHSNPRLKPTNTIVFNGVVGHTMSTVFCGIPPFAPGLVCYQVCSGTQDNDLRHGCCAHPKRGLVWVCPRQTQVLAGQKESNITNGCSHATSADVLLGVQPPRQGQPVHGGPGRDKL